MMNSQFDILTAIYNDIKDQQYKYAVLPWGATEPHNYHLPYLTDCYLSHDISVDAVVKTYRKAGIKGMVLPPIPLGSQNPGQRELPFCLHTRYETQRAILGDIVSSLNYQGITTLIIVNGHGGNNFKNMIRDLAIDYPDFLIATSDWFALTPQKEFFDEIDDHAGEMETSVMMHYHPELVDLNLAGSGKYTPFSSKSLVEKIGWIPRNWAKVSEDTGIGNPQKSTAEKGARCADFASEKLSELFIDLANRDIY